MDTEKGGGQDFDWLEEGFEGLDFDDDVFGNVDDGPSTHDRVSGSVAALHRLSEGDNVNAAPHRPSEGDTVNAAHIGLLQLTMTHLLKRVNGLTNS